MHPINDFAPSHPLATTLSRSIYGAPLQATIAMQQDAPPFYHTAPSM